MCWNSWTDGYPSFVLTLFAYPLLTWLVLGLIDLAAVVVCYASLTREMPRWFGVVAWLSLPLAVGASILFLLLLATRLFQRIH